jgi:four helix bundle protein
MISSAPRWCRYARLVAAWLAVHDFRKLAVWHMSRELGSELYLRCSRITRPETKLITTQLRRSALGISSAIAEGCGKRTRAETLRYLDIAGGSAAETEHHLIVAMETGVLDEKTGEDYLGRLTSIRRMLVALMRKLPDGP